MRAGDTFIELVRQAWLYALSRRTEFVGALGDHLLLVGIALGVSVLLCVPLGVWTSRAGSASAPVMGLVTGLRSLPSLAVLFVLIPYLGLSLRSATLALTLLAMPPILINTDAAFRTLDAAVLEAARAMGMTRRQVLLRVEAPLALPVVLAGVRTAAVEVLSSAVLAAFVGSGGLGIYITRGFALFDYSILLVGAVPIAALTLFAEVALTGLARAAEPRGRRTVGRPAVKGV